MCLCKRKVLANRITYSSHETVISCLQLHRDAVQAQAKVIVGRRGNGTQSRIQVRVCLWIVSIVSKSTTCV